MSTPEPSLGHFLQYFFADVRTKADLPLLCERQGAIFRTVTHRETIARLGDMARSLCASAVGPGDRVALHAAASPNLLIGEWAVLACRAVAVIVPRDFSPNDLVETLLESKSRLVIVDRLATAFHLANATQRLPDLRHIVCVEAGAQAQLPISSWGDFMDMGRTEPDRSTASLRAIADKDTALLFYHKDTRGSIQATRYSHAQLLDYAGRIDAVLGTNALRAGELVVTATAWENGLGHIAACYAPALKSAVIQITYGTPDVTLFENSPQALVGDAVFFEGLRQNVVEMIRQWGQVESFMLQKALALSKQHYESSRSIGPLSRLLLAALQVTIIKKVKKMLGGKLRLLIGTDNEAHYGTQLFFHAFGAELVELPEEAFR